MSQAKTKMHAQTRGMYPLKTQAKQRSTHPSKLYQAMMNSIIINHKLDGFDSFQFHDELKT